MHEHNWKMKLPFIYIKVNYKLEKDIQIREYQGTCTLVFVASDPQTKKLQPNILCDKDCLIECLL